MEYEDKIAREGLALLRQDFQRHVDACERRQLAILIASLSTGGGVLLLLLRSFGGL